jgi:hypothetical protein
LLAYLILSVFPGPPFGGLGNCYPFQAGPPELLTEDCRLRA